MNTPETDKFWKQLGEQYHMSPYQFAAMLETERNEARKQRDEYMEGWQLECEFRDMYRKQRDELLAALELACNYTITGNWYEQAQQAIANVKGEMV